MILRFFALSYKYGFKPIDRNIHTVKEIPFESEKKYSARFYKDNNEVKVAVKGAFEVVSDYCTRMKMGSTLVDIDNKRIERQIKTLSSTGYRVIALAEGELPKVPEHNYSEKNLKNLTFLGLIGLIDPLRPEAISAVDTCKKAGIKVIMITGDHPETAFTIGKNLGIIDSKGINKGADLAEIKEKSKEFTRLVSRIKVFARVTPLQKLSIIEALINSGDFIAVT